MIVGTEYIYIYDCLDALRNQVFDTKMASKQALVAVLKLDV